MIDQDKLRSLFADQIAIVVKRISEQEAKKAALETERLVRDAVCQIVGQVSSYFSYEKNGHDMHITVKFPRTDGTL